MSHAQPFTPEEIERLNQLEQLINQPITRMDVLRKTLAAGFKLELLNELLARVERHEAKQLKAKNSRVDLKRALVRGQAWKTPEGKLAYTWPDADDGKIAPVGALPILYVVDLPTGQLQPHRGFMALAICKLGLSPANDNESEVEILLKQLNEWLALADENFEKDSSRPLWLDLLENIDAHQDATERRLAYAAARESFCAYEAEAAPRRNNDAAHNLAIELWTLCDAIRNDMNGSGNELESRLGLVNQAFMAEQLADRLKRVASKGNSRRSLKMLEKMGRNADPFAEAVREACEVCWSAQPGKRPSSKQICAAMNAQIEKREGESYVIPRGRSKKPWKSHSRKHFDNAVTKWWATKKRSVDSGRVTQRTDQ